MNVASAAARRLAELLGIARAGAGDIGAEAHIIPRILRWVAHPSPGMTRCAAPASASLARPPRPSKRGTIRTLEIKVGQLHPTAR
jgi:hypothetical protein